MASSMTSPPAVSDRFDLGIQNSPAIVNGPVGVSPGPGRTAQTPSSPLSAATTAAATEGQRSSYVNQINFGAKVDLIDSPGAQS
ncbi:hypothetical protein FOCG_18249 [Fusarium oxysporum f. sp. radicis-lycopersici 26381]|nr:hypothetical protein FOCG_18249 [Fusarium oxysporum f. sp. radicis-lycopersici 26381]